MSDEFDGLEVKPDKHDEIMIWIDQNIGKVIGPLIPEAFRDQVEYQKTWELPVGVTQGRVDGFIDMRVEVMHEHICKDTIYIEVKPTIPSIGALIRQVQKYRAHLRGFSKFIVVSPDDRFKSILQGQQIQFFKYEE